MTRQEAAANARRVRMSRRGHATKLHDEIIGLRSQVGGSLLKLVGASGTRVNLGDIDEEYVPELKTLAGRTTIYDQMVNDPVIRGQLTTITSTLTSGVRWKVEGGTPEMQDLVAANLLRQGPRKFWCSTSWIDRLHESLGFLIYGFSMFAKTRKVVDDRIIFSDLKWLHPRSVMDANGWVMDADDRLIGINRHFTDATGQSFVNAFIPADDLFIMPWDRRGPNWEGTAFIRAMYKPWKLRQLAEKIDMIDLQNRGVGIPMAKLSGTGGPKERDTLVQILKDLRGGSKERAFIVLDKDSDVKFLVSEGQAREAQTIIDGKRSDIAMVAVAQYLESGNTASGSRASSSSMSVGFFVFVDSIKVKFEDLINFGAGPMEGPVEELLRMNFDEEELDDVMDDPTRITGSRVSPTEQLDNVPLIFDGVQKGALTKTLDLENDLRRKLNSPPITREQFDEAKAAAVPNIGGRPGEAPISTDPPDPREDTDSNRLRTLAEKKTPDAFQQMRKSAYALWLG